MTASTSDRAAWRLAVADVATRGNEKLPQCAGRIVSAVKIVLAGDVDLLPQGGARVASRTDATVQYHVVNGHCDCKDYAKAPGNLCAHRLAYGIARRAAELVPVEEPVSVPAQALPEAAFSLTLKGKLDGVEALLTVRGQTAAEFKAHLEAVRGLLDTPAQPETREGWCQGR